MFKPKNLAALLTGLLLLALIGGQALAAEMLEKQVPQGYDVTVYLNVRQVMDTPALQPLRDVVLNETVQVFFQNVQQLSGIDLTKDLDEFVMASSFDPARKGNNLVLVRGRLDKDAVLKIFSVSPQFKEIPAAKSAIYEYWSEGDRELRYLAFPAPGVLAMGLRAPVEGSLAETGRLAENPEYAQQLKALSPAALFRLVTASPMKFQMANPFAVALRKSVRAFRASAELSNSMKIGLNLTATDSVNAERWRDMIKGLLAASQMMDKFPKVGALAGRVTLETAQANLSTSLNSNVDEMLDLLALSPKFSMLKDRKRQ